MIVKLSKDCRLRADDGVQFVLEMRERISDKPVGGRVSEQAGKLSGWKTKGYYGTLGAALKGVVKHTMVSSKPSAALLTAKQLGEHLERITRRIEKACEGLLEAREAAGYSGVVDPEELDELFNMESEKVA